MLGACDPGALDGCFRFHLTAISTELDPCGRLAAPYRPDLSGLLDPAQDVFPFDPDPGFTTGGDRKPLQTAVSRTSVICTPASKALADQPSKRRIHADQEDIRAGRGVADGAVRHHVAVLVRDGMRRAMAGGLV